jgi:pilus assembly protein Flp/PilA
VLVPPNMTRRRRPAHRIACFARALLRSQRGSSAVEYGFILALIVLASFVALAQLADVTQTMWSDIRTRVTNASQG